MNANDKDVVSVGCRVKLYCPTDGEHYEYRIVKSRDTTEFIPQFGGYNENQNYDSRPKIAEYAEDELGDDRPLAKELLGKRRGDTVKVFTYSYQIEDIIFPSKKSDVKQRIDIANSENSLITIPDYGIDFCETPNSGKATEPIDEFLLRVWNDFDRYIDTSDRLCDLKSITFEGDCLPDYEDVHIQQLYLLRYVLAYAYEYKCMYKAVLERGGFHSEIKVTSFGCGSMIDYWSLAEVLLSRCDGSVINYTGIDLTDWKYKMRKRTCDDVRLIQKNVVDWFNEIACFTSDIFIFPKSISELGNSVFDKICNNFQTKTFLNDRFHVLICLRYNPNNGKINKDDLTKCISIYNAIKANGFLCDDNPYKTLPEVMEDKNIWVADNTLNYTQRFNSEILNQLSAKCRASSEEKENCLSSCQGINRYAMLSTKYACYQIFTFYRRKVQ